LTASAAAAAAASAAAAAVDDETTPPRTKAVRGMIVAFAEKPPANESGSRHEWLPPKR